MSASIRVQTPPAETEFVEIPATGLKVSRVALGTWAMGGWMWGGTDRHVIHLAVRWMLDQGIDVALWGGRHPDQVEAALGVAGWSLKGADRELVERIVNAAVTDPVGPEFMAPAVRSTAQDTGDGPGTEHICLP
jgi:aryl-alcohol dehydrogenase-like predicted oxidoreductase